MATLGLVFQKNMYGINLAISYFGGGGGMVTLGYLFQNNTYDLNLVISIFVLET
jgi:hypothetical protein